MTSKNTRGWTFFVGIQLILGAYSCSHGSQSPQVPAPALLFEGARLIVGDGSAPIENSAFLVQEDKIVWVGRKDERQVPPGANRIDLNGKTVMPALVDLHSHLGYTNIKNSSTSVANYTRENLIDHLQRYAYYGIAATLSTGVDRGDVPFQLREETIPNAALFRTAGRGIAPPNAGPLAEYRREALYGVTTEADSRHAVQELAAKQVDVVKIWVDDRDGSVNKLSPPLYRAIIDEAHKHSLRVLAHVSDLEDAKELLRSGIDISDLVRERDVDDEFIALMKERPDVFVMSNLPDSGIPEDLSWLGDTVPPVEVARMREAQAHQKPADARAVRERFGIQARNLAKLNAAGVRIGFGTDGSSSVGWNAHTELADMVTAGMTPAQVIVAATRTSAEALRLDQIGTVAAGKSASFIVLDGNPLDDITNTRRISRVYLRGNEIDRAALKAAW